jgi:hypothetical protein
MEPAIDLAEVEARIRAGVLGFTPEVRLALLRWILAPDQDRAAIAGDLYQLTDGGSIAELLIDLEQDRPTALIVADVLKGWLRCCW